MKYFTLGILVLLLHPAISMAKSCDREKADTLVKQAFDLGVQANKERQHSLLKNALDHCPSHAEALNNLGVLSEQHKNFKQALSYYKLALKKRPNFATAWKGLGDVYKKQGQLPLALEAYSKACPQNKDAKDEVKALLKNQRYRFVENHQVLNKESLLVLYNPERHQAILKTKDCDFNPRLIVKSSAVFRNLSFKTGSKTLKKKSLPQLMEIAAALQSLNRNVQIDGHSDPSPFKGYTLEESQDLNRKLSLDRANAIKTVLVKQGVDAIRIRTQGYGSERPLVLGNSKTAYAKNRRVEISFQEQE